MTLVRWEEEAVHIEYPLGEYFMMVTVSSGKLSPTT